MSTIHSTLTDIRFRRKVDNKTGKKNEDPTAAGPNQDQRSIATHLKTKEEIKKEKEEEN